VLTRWRFRNIREGRIGREIGWYVTEGRRLGGSSRYTLRSLVATLSRTSVRAAAARESPIARRALGMGDGVRTIGPPHVIDLDLLWQYLTIVRSRRLRAGDPGVSGGPLSPGAEPLPCS
jgi:hypothetical protein